MIEPPRTDRYVAFSRQPLVSVFHSPLVLCIMCLLVQRIGRPVCFAGPTGLVADPADIGNRSAEDHRFRMFRFDHFTGSLVAVIGFRIDRTRFIRSTVPAISSVRPVKPELEQRTVVGDQFVDLLMIGLLVSFPPIFGIMTIPGREVKPELQAVLLAGIGQFANHVALSVFIRRVRDIIVDRFGRPKAKAVVMLSCQDHPFQAGRFDDTYPLFAIQVCRIECFRRCIPIAPFQIIECVQPEMHECIILHFLPFDLLRRRERIRQLELLGVDAVVHLIAQDGRAELDAFVADVDVGAGDDPADLLLTLAAEGAADGVSCQAGLLLSGIIVSCR